MELCISRAFSNLHHQRFFSTNPCNLRSKNSLPLKRTTISRNVPGLLNSPLLKFASSDEKFNSVNETYEEASYGVITVEKSPTDEQNILNESTPVEEVPKSETPTGEQMQAFEFLDSLNIKLDSEDTYSILIYGSGALVALWLASRIVGAIDSIPVFPKALELVGLAFTIWFSSRNLIFKKNRDELLSIIEELKQEIIGSTDD